MRIVARDALGQAGFSPKKGWRGLLSEEAKPHACWPALAIRREQPTKICQGSPGTCNRTGNAGLARSRTKKVLAGRITVLLHHCEFEN
jgi:hypothetical protein